ncbi:MAG TPA: lasso peptide biosynthesis B2 protein [Gemmatimonadales bacterium]|nr:lasso peptide biosynthesis B2 protein [Gemmatimonadales bacterium]
MTLRAIAWWRARTVATVLLIPPLLHFAPLQRLAPRLGGRPSSPPPPLPTERVVDWVDMLLHRLPWPWRFTCLKRAAVLYALFRRSGMPVELWIGVRRDPDGHLAAHAWLVRDGAPYLEALSDPLGTFQVIARFPQAAPVAP